MKKSKLDLVLGEPHSASKVKELLKDKRELIDKLARGNESAKEVLEFMCSYSKDVMALSAKRLVPVLQDKGIGGEILGFMWDLCEKEFLIFAALAKIIPTDTIIAIFFALDSKNENSLNELREPLYELILNIKKQNADFMDNLTE